MARGNFLTGPEAEIMNSVLIVSQQSRFGATVKNVHKNLYPKGEKALTTVQTVMDRLERKGFLKKEMIGLVNFYTPAISREEIIKSEVLVLAARWFKGSLADLSKTIKIMERRDG
ncbi:MAG: BlaI/MecI/CopY family transcriptional regulator [Patescibacteria group bacterium]